MACRSRTQPTLICRAAEFQQHANEEQFLKAAIGQLISSFSSSIRAQFQKPLGYE
jgi:hypothetical protein